MKPISTQRATQNRERRKILNRSHTPERCYKPGCTHPADDPHEPLTRARGGSITDPFNIVPLCRQCHDEVGAGPDWAYDLGLLRHSWDLLTSPESVTIGNMPTAKTELLGTRISPEANDWVNGLAEQFGLGRSDIGRALFAVAGQHPREVTAKLEQMREAQADGPPRPGPKPAPKPSQKG